MHDPRIAGAVGAALETLERTLAEQAPYCGEQFAGWTGGLYAGDPVRAWLNPASIPVIQLPVWLADSCGASLDDSFLTSVTMSSICGYMYVRLIDKVMDGDSGADPSLLPIAAVLHMHFHAAYVVWFPHGHPFWSFFTQTWSDAADTTLRDRLLSEVTESNFETISSRKFSAAKIPLAAAAWRVGRTDVIASWHSFLEALGAWYQLNNDFFDWERDARHGVQTYILTEARRRSRPGESLPEWFSREGVVWGAALLRDRFAQVATQADSLRSAGLSDFMAARAAILDARLEAAIASRGVLAALAVFA